ncbi:MAG TPA: hypothetical protein VF469_11395 [Kofleriaceae bacterium]
MRTLAAWGFIAGVAALAIWLARTPTVADGRALAADRIEEFRKDGVTGMECDDRIPIGRNGAAFTCIAALQSGATQVVDFTLKPDGSLAWKPQPPTRTPPTRKPVPPERNPVSDPRGN